MLQTAGLLRVRAEERELLGGAEEGAGRGRPGLQGVEQPAGEDVLRLRFMQEGGVGEHPEGVEGAGSHQHLHRRRRRRRLLRRLLCPQEQPLLRPQQQLR